MAMQTSHAPGHAKTASGGSARSLPSHPSRGGSPTLTNPDMILPGGYDDYPDSVSSPDRSESPLTMWKRANGFDTTPMQQFDLGAPGFAPAPVTPTTPIIYGNGTMLSDIGEVTEAESTTGSVLRNKTAYHGPSYEAMHAQPLTSTPAYEAAKRRVAEQRMASQGRRASIESTSTVTNGDNPGVFADFDDSVSVDDSVFQGDDEDSVAESYVYDDALRAGDRTPTGDTFADRSFIEGQERYSTALSRRAEQILANAKRRLTTMEGNLSRARSSISSYGDASTPSPPLARGTTALHRDHDSAIQKNPLGHSRISSENNIPSDLKPGHAFTPRSSSAMGAVGGQRQPLTISRSAEYMRDRTKHDSPLEGTFHGNASHARSKPALYEDKHFLEPLSEDEGVPELDSAGTSTGDATLESFLSPTFGPYQGQELRRSASTVQMRDLKHQMSDLKGRLSSLRDQARADSMKRRSLSSLRTPSPFTHARVEQWYATRNADADAGDAAEGPVAEADGVEGEVRGGLEVDGQGIKPNRLSSEGESLYTDFDERSPRTKLFPAESQQSPGKNTPVARTADESRADDYDDEADGDDMKTEDGSEDEDDGFVDIESVADTESICDSDSTCETASDSGESLYHDSVQNQLSHEDREDAFDYEHFFLHSAMGTMSQKRMRRSDSVSSYSSETSVETTRGPVVSGSNRRRRDSDASMATTATADSFATATEGRLTRAGTSAHEKYPEEMMSPTFPGPAAGYSDRFSAHTPETGKRLTFGFNGLSNSAEATPDHHRESVGRRPLSSAAAFSKRPSVSSLGSTGTTRSFPLVTNRLSKTNGVLTPNASPDHELKQLSDTLMSETASLCGDTESIAGDDTAINHLAKEDQILVQRLVASLGKCVLGMSESGRASAETRMYRRRLDAARRTLEGSD